MTITLRMKGDSSNSTTLSLKTADRDITSSKMRVGVGSGIPMYIRFGYEETWTVTGQIFSSTDYNKIKLWTPDTILECTNSSYPEFTATTTYDNYILVDKAKINRKGGYLDMWNYSFTFVVGSIKSGAALTALTATTDFTTTALSATTIDMNTNQVANIPIGSTLKIVCNGVTILAQVANITATVMTITGGTMSTGAGHLTAVSYKRPEKFIRWT